MQSFQGLREEPLVFVVHGDRNAYLGLPGLFEQVLLKSISLMDKLGGVASDGGVPDMGELVPRSLLVSLLQSRSHGVDAIVEFRCDRKIEHVVGAPESLITHILLRGLVEIGILVAPSMITLYKDG